MRFPTEKLQVFADGSFYFGVTRQSPSSAHAESLGRLQFCKAIIINALLDNDPGSFLRENPPRAFVTVYLPFRHCRPVSAVPGPAYS